MSAEHKVELDAAQKHAKLMSKSCLARISLDVRQLGAKFPPRLFNGNKKFLYELACPKGVDSLSEILTFSRWGAVRMPSKFTKHVDTELTAEQNVYPYEISKDGDADFYVNFADQELFGFYGGSLFAQDELQVAEHPALMVLREFLVDFNRRNDVAGNELLPLTSSGSNPTPCVVMNVERMCAVKLDRNAEQGRPQGLYGNNFAAASKEALLNGVVPLKPPTKSHIIAMAALSYGHGEYTQGQVKATLETAYTAFSGARCEAYSNSGYVDKESFKVVGPEKKPRVIIHTGNWGCGAFGGNKVLMMLLQMAAAHMAQIDQIVFHTVDRSGMEAFRAAQEKFNELISAKGGSNSASGGRGNAFRAATSFFRKTASKSADDSDDGFTRSNKFVSDVVDQKFSWGISNGT